MHQQSVAPHSAQQFIKVNPHPAWTSKSNWSPTVITASFRLSTWNLIYGPTLFPWDLSAILIPAWSSPSPSRSSSFHHQWTQQGFEPSLAEKLPWHLCIFQLISRNYTLALWSNHWQKCSAAAGNERLRASEHAFRKLVFGIILVERSSFVVNKVSATITSALFQLTQNFSD